MIVERNVAPVPLHLASLAVEGSKMSFHSTDRLLSGLVRRFLLTDQFLSPHRFFISDGLLGIHLMGEAADYKPSRGADLLNTGSREGLDALGLYTATDIVEACFNDRYYGMPETSAQYTETEDMLVIDDHRTGGRLLVRWGDDATPPPGYTFPQVG